MKTLRGSRRYILGVAGLHALALALLMDAAPRYPMLPGLMLLAYTFGLRHAFDVDHIAFIDNTVRHFLQQRRRPQGIGFYFSLGHSTIVVLMVVATVFAVHLVQRHLPVLEQVGGVLGSLVSGLFLLVLAGINLLIWTRLLRVFLLMRRRGNASDDMDALLDGRGFFARMVVPLTKWIREPWHAYPIGFLFGLGFDTASEVALLAMSAAAARHVLPLAGVLALPAAFAAGMSLMDTADGIFMSSAYKWAFSTPLRKLYYNLTVTGLGVLAACLIGVIELGQVVTRQIGETGGFGGWLQHLDFGVMGYVLVTLFVLVWMVSYGAWKFLKIEQRWVPEEP